MHACVCACVRTCVCACARTCVCACVYACMCACGVVSYRVFQDIYMHNPNVRWDDIIGLDAAKRLVKEAVVYPIRVSELPGCS